MVFKKKARRYGRRMFGRRTSSRKSNSSMSPLMVAGGSAAYAVVRPYAANIIPDIPQLGEYSDNVIIGAAGALAAWKGRGIVKKAGMIVLANESFIAASKATQGMSTQTGSSGIYIN